MFNLLLLSMNHNNIRSVSSVSPIATVRKLFERASPAAVCQAS